MSIHNNKGAEYNPPAVTSASAYKTLTEVEDRRVEAEVTGNNLLGIISRGLPNTFADDGNFGASANLIPIPLPFGGDPYADFKKAAVYKACQKADCDYLINAQYVINVKDYFVFKQATVKVSVFPVKVKGFAPINEEKK